MDSRTLTIRRALKASGQIGRFLVASFPLLIVVSAVGFHPLVNSVAQAQVGGRSASKFYADSSDPADTLLRNAANHARDGQWAEAISMYQRIVQQYGDKVAKLPKSDREEASSDDFQLYVDLRQFCQRQLTLLPPEAREIYRRRVDSQAERWYQQGLNSRDRDPLRKVIEQAFASSWGDDAAELLGDIAYQDGHFDEALSRYRLIAPDKPDDPGALVHPDPSVDVPKVAAKKLLCLAALGEKSSSNTRLAEFEKRFPNSGGSLAGRDGPFSESLKAAVTSDHLEPPVSLDGRWPTFAGSPSRTRIVPGPIDVGSKQWRVDLESVQRNRGGRGPRGAAFPLNPIAPHRLLAYHPIVLGDQVIITNGSQINAYNLNDRPETIAGAVSDRVKPVWKYEADRDALSPQAARNLSGPPRYTLTAFNNRIYARLGPNITPNFGSMGGGVAQSRIVALDPTLDNKLLWSKLSTDVLIPRRIGELASRNVGFEGTPVADEQNVYVALTDRREQTATYVACLNSETGATRWVRYLGTASSEADNAFVMGGNLGGMGGGVSGDFGHRLLSLKGPTLYYQTNLGAVIALETESGLVRWVATYPRIDRNGIPSDRDLNPAILYEDLVIVAPDDSPSILAFHADTGRLAWKTEPISDEVRLAHLLGVAKDRLVATGDRLLLFDVKNGKLAYSWPDSGKGFEGFGRGVLAGDKIYWPTRNEIQVLDQGTGLRSEAPIKLQEAYQTTGGNLAVGDGYLIVAQADQMIVFCQNRRLIERYRDEIAKNSNQGSNYFLLAQAAEATGQDDLALDSLDQALLKARPSDMIDGTSLIDSTRDQRFRLLVKMGRKARASGNLGQAESRFTLAASTARLDRDRLQASLIQSDVQLQRMTPEASVRTLQALLADDRLRTLNMAAEEGRRSIRADLLISDHLTAILSVHGREFYETFDREARGLFEKAKTDSDPAQLDHLLKRYPVAEVVPDALLNLGRLQMNAGQPREASRAYKKLLAFAPNESYRASALLGLARAYDQQKLWVPARDTYQQAISRFATIDVESDEPGSLTKLGPLVEQRLAQAPFDAMLSDRSEPNLPIPLGRRWTRNLNGSARPLTVEGTAPSSEASRILLVNGTTLNGVDAQNGASSWSVDLGGTPIWAGYLDDRLIAGSDSKLVAINLKNGQELWHYEAGPVPAGKSSNNPFTKSATTKPNGQRSEAEPESSRLHGFRISGGQVVLLKGHREIVAFEGESGLVDWSFQSTGQINPKILVGPHKIVAQLRKPDSILVLETSSGRKLVETPLTVSEDWPRAPLAVDEDHVALVLDRLTIALFDLNRGSQSWQLQHSREMPKNGPPLLLGDSERFFMIHDGNELIRLDVNTGAKKWSRPLGIYDLGEHPEAIAIDGEKVYWVSGQSLNAARLEDGSIVWSQFLTGPESGWSIELTEHCVLSYPGLNWKSNNPIERLPLVFRKRDSGELVQRLLFDTAVNDVSVRLLQGGALVATPTGLWALGERRPMDGFPGGR